MAADKKISELPILSAVTAADTSVVVHNGTDYQFNFDALLTFINSGISGGATVSFGSTLPQNTTGKNGDLFINTTAGSFAQKTSGAWQVKYTLPSAATEKDGTVLYGSGVPGTSTGNNNDTYINTNTGIFYRKNAGAWSQVFSMQTGPQGARGEKGDKGDTGANGRAILSDTSNPSNLSTGTDGDFYINTNSLQLFGPKTSGVWPAGISLVGINGEQGETGPQGDTGADGINGTNGLNGEGVPAGGTAGQVLAKVGDGDYDTEWVEMGAVNYPFGTLFYASETIVWDFNDKKNQQVVLYGNAKISISNMSDGEVGLLVVKQDNVGGRSLTLSGDVRVAGSIAGEIELSTEPDREDSLYMFKKGTTLYVQVAKYYVGLPVIPDSLFLDAFKSDIKAGFSTSKLFTTSTNCVRVRRSSDNTEQDFNFTIDGVLDVVAMATFIGVGNGFIVKWYDQTGNNNHYAQATMANQPKVKFNSLNGLPSLEFDGATSYMQTNSFTNSSFDKSCSIVTLANKYSDAFRLHDANEGGTYYGARNETNVIANTSGMTGGNAVAVPGYLQNVTQHLLETFTYDGSDRRFYINNSLYGAIHSPYVTDKMNFSGKMTMGNLNGTGFWWDGEIFTKLYLNTALSENNLKIVGRKIGVDYGIIKVPHITFDGNSLTFGVNSSSGDNRYPGTSYPSQLIAAIGGTGSLTFRNQGQSGGSTEDIITQVTAPNIYNTNGLSSKLIQLFWEGRNSLYKGDTAVQAYNAMITYLTQYRSLGYKKIAVLTCEPTIASPTSGNPAENNIYGVSTNSYEAQRLIYNQMIRDNVAGGYFDYVIDIAADNRIGALATIDNLTYWDSFGVHMTDAGYQIVAQLCAVPLNFMLAD